MQVDFRQGQGQKSTAFMGRLNQQTAAVAADVAQAWKHMHCRKASPQGAAQSGPLHISPGKLNILSANYGADTQLLGILR